MSFSESRLNSERALIDQVAKRLRARGWSVDVEPVLGPSRPDLVARRPDGYAAVLEFKIAAAIRPVHFASLAQVASYARLAEAYLQVQEAFPVLIVSAAAPAAIEEAAVALGVQLITLRTVEPSGQPAAERIASEVVAALPVPRRPSDAEWRRALARIDEFSTRSPTISRGPSGALRSVVEANVLMEHAVDVALETDRPRDAELVHRYAVEELGPAALHARRLWTDIGGDGAFVNPTLPRLPAMIQELGRPLGWLGAPQPLLAWRDLLEPNVRRVHSAQISDPNLGDVLLMIVGLCAEVASWIRTTFGVGD